MAVSKPKLLELTERMKRLNIKDADLLETFVMGTGPGGQKINKTAICVHLKHLPSGISVKCEKDRSRELNRFLARRELCERLEKELFGTKTKKEKQLEKIKKQKNRRKRKNIRKINPDIL